MCRSSEIKAGAPLPNTDEISRYCKPSDFDLKKNEPKVSAFQRAWKQPQDCEEPPYKEPFLSVNWLEYFGQIGRERAIDSVRTAFDAKHYEVKMNGRFVVIGISTAKAAAKCFGLDLAIKYKPEADDPSHAGVFGLPDEDEDEIDIAAELKLLVTGSDIYLGII